ncbi:MAG: hypothetical protein JSS68_14210 [Actinobacteria bacterium]|nr:hypothetical protein [Actinomycetota bacterium]MBS1885004.1 hypothetical protein [Actinomycetota bacterium]
MTTRTGRATPGGHHAALTDEIDLGGGEIPDRHRTGQDSGSRRAEAGGAFTVLTSCPDTLASMRCPKERNNMIRRLNKLLVTLAAVAAMGVGGAALAAAQQGGSVGHKADQHKVHKPSRAATASQQTGEGTGNVQEGDQGGENVQEGDQGAPDTGQAGEQGAEGDGQPGSEGDTAQESDGPGGHADPPGANVDHQFEGEE